MVNMKTILRGQHIFKSYATTKKHGDLFNGDLMVIYWMEPLEMCDMGMENHHFESSIFMGLHFQ